MPSAQVITTPFLRQYATLVDDGLIEVATKLGSSTISRSTFAVVELPAESTARMDFLKGLLQKGNPSAMSLLKDNVDKCLRDQAEAVRRLMAEQ